MSRFLIVSIAIWIAAASSHAATTPQPTHDGGNELSADDGKSAGKKSVAGSGHAVALEAPAGAKLTHVKIFGSRYGHPQPPAEG